MNYYKLILIIPTLFLLALSMGCDSENSGNANAQPAPMSGTDVTGKINTPSEQGCPASILIEGFKAADSVIMEISSTGDMTGDVIITNSTTSTSASCSGSTEDTLPPAEVKSCKVSSSNISGIEVDDILEIDVVFESSTKESSIDNLSGPDGISCAILTIETLNAN